METLESAPAQIQHLRDEAVARLQDAAWCEDPVRRDALLREALGLLSRARVLRSWAQDQARDADGFGDGLGSGAGLAARTH